MGGWVIGIIVVAFASLLVIITVMAIREAGTSH